MMRLKWSDGRTSNAPVREGEVVALTPDADADVRILSFNVHGGAHALSIDQDGRVLVGADEKEVYRFPPDETEAMLRVVAEAAGK